MPKVRGSLIFRQVLRLEKAIEKAVKKRVRKARLREPKRDPDIPEFIFVIDETCPIPEEKVAPVINAPVTTENRKSPSLDETSASSSGPSSIAESQLPLQDDYTSVSDDSNYSLNSIITHDLEYRTIDQNEFLIDCIMNEQGSFFVHFVAEKSPLTEAIDKQMEQVRKQSLCRCLRIDAKLAPLMIAKLKINANTPTVVALKNGSLVSRISSFSSADCKEVQKWAFTIELLSL